MQATSLLYVKTIFLEGFYPNTINFPDSLQKNLLDLYIIQMKIATNTTIMGKYSLTMLPITFPKTYSVSNIMNTNTPKLLKNREEDDE
jgi:hypothetical protein